MRFGVNTWVWTSPTTTEELRKLAPHVASLGFDWIEVPLESVDDMDHAEGAKIVRDNGLGVSTCAAMGPDRDLIHPDEAIHIAAQTARGAASLLLKSARHPEGEIDKVTTPRGCTIAGLNQMEHEGFSSAMIKGIVTSCEKAGRLYKQNDNK